MHIPGVYPQKFLHIKSGVKNSCLEQTLQAILYEEWDLRNSSRYSLLWDKSRSSLQMANVRLRRHIFAGLN